MREIGIIWCDKNKSLKMDQKFLLVFIYFYIYSSLFYNVHVYFYKTHKNLPAKTISSSLTAAIVCCLMLFE